VFELAGARHVRAAAQVFKRTFAVERHVLVGRNACDDFGLVVLAQAFEIRHRIVARQHTTLDLLVLLGQLDHLGFDGGEVVQSEWALVGKVVEEPVINHGADGDLRIGKQLLHCIRQQVRRGVANHLQTGGVFLRDDGQRAVMLNAKTGVHDLRRIALPDPSRQCRFGQTRTNAGGHFGHGDRARVFAFGSVGELN